MLTITMGGYSAILPTPEVMEAIEKLVPTSLYGPPVPNRSTWNPTSNIPLFPNQEPVEPPNWPDPPHIKINQLYWPVCGASRFAYGYFLFRGDAYYEWAALSTSYEMTVLDTDTSQGFTTRMFPLDPRVVIQDPGNVGDSIYVIPVVDERFFWQYKVFNEIEDVSPETWTELLDLMRPTIEAQNPLFIDPAAVSVFENNSPDMMRPSKIQLSESWNTVGPVLDSAMAATGFRYAKTPQNSQITTAPTQPWTPELPANIRIGGGDTTPRIPDRILFRFWDGELPRNISRAKPVSPDSFVSAPEWAISLNSSMVSGDLVRVDAYVDTLSARFFQWRKTSYDVSYKGIVAFIPNQVPDITGTIDSFFFCLGSISDFDNTTVQMTTRIASLPAWVVNQQILIDDPEHEETPDISQILKIGKTDGPIEPGQTGLISIWRNGVDTLEDELAVLDWMDGDQKISANKEVLIAWFEDEEVWRIIESECESPEEPDIQQVANFQEPQTLTVAWDQIPGMTVNFESGNASQVVAPPP